MQTYLEKHAEKMLVKKGEFIARGPYLRVFAWYSRNSDDQLSKWQKQVWKRNRNRLLNDYVGMATGSQYLPLLWKKHDMISLAECRNIVLTKAQYDPERKILSMDIKGGKDSLLRLRCGRVPEKAFLSGEQLALIPAPDGTFQLCPEERSGILTVEFKK